MTAEQLINTIAERGLLPDRLVAKLRAKVLGADEPMSAEALAKFLVAKQHLSQAQADELLSANEADGRGDEGIVNLAFVDTHVSADRSSGLIMLGGADDDIAADSSVFTPAPTRRIEADNPDDFELVPLDESGVLPATSDVLEVSSIIEPPGIVDLTALVAGGESFDEQLPSDSLVTLGMEPESQERVKEKVEKQLGLLAAEPAAVERKKKKVTREKRWDSPLLLIGGGALALMLLCGGAVALYLTWEGGDQKLHDARAARDAGSYLQAVQRYEEFLDKYTTNPNWSEGRVELSVLRLRQAVESGGNLQPAVETATQELAAIENEESFGKIREELAGLLPALARGLANEAAKETENLEAAEQLSKASEEALALCRTAKYIPKALRDDSALESIEETLAGVRQRRESLQALQDAVTSMKTAVAGGDTRAAYAAHKLLLRDHPELSNHPALAAALMETSSAEQAAVKFVEEKQAAETADRPTPWVAMLATGNRHVATASSTGGVYCASVDGALYGFNVADGKLLWRRYMGYGDAAWPIDLGDDVLTIDSKQAELVRLDAKTGKLIWRQAIGEAFASPLVIGDQAFVATDSGRLYIVELASGERLGYLQFAQPLNVTPVANRTGKRLYLTGDHSSIYSISLDDRTCLGVRYLGHSSGSIRVPPALVLNKIAVVENDGVATSRLRLLAINDDGSVGEQVAEHRLTGLAAAPPLATARRLMVVTDRGELAAFDVASENDANVLTLVATREPTSRQPLVRHVLLTQGAIWIGDNRLTKHAIVPTGNRLPGEAIENSFEGDTFDHPLALFGETLVSVHRPMGRAGVIVSAVDAESGALRWQNVLAVPPVGIPIADASSRTLAFANVNGLVFRFDEQALRSRVQDQPLSPGPLLPGAAKLTVGVDAGSGRAAFAAPRESAELLLYNPAAARQPLKPVKLPSTVAAAMSRFANGLIVPLEIGQVFFIDAADGQSLATPFQPRLAPNEKIAYQPACQVDDAGRQFVITDGREKIYRVELVDQPSPHLALAAEANVGPYPVVSPLVANGVHVFAVTEGHQLARFQLPTLENVGQTDLAADAVWGPYRVGELVLLATADEQLVAVDANGASVWTTPLAGGDLAGLPLETAEGVLIAYRNGKLEKRMLANGQAAGVVDLLQPLASGPVRFMGRLVIATHDGSLLVVNEP
jgi:outer membrane protein assembly factor BamB